MVTTTSYRLDLTPAPFNLEQGELVVSAEYLKP